MKKALIIGAGLSGCCAGRLLAEADYDVTIIECRHHLGGNIYDEYNGDILVQKYGPHIWHTNNPEINEFMLRFTDEVIPFSHKVLAITDSGVLPYPVNTSVAQRIYGRSLEEELNDNVFFEQPSNMKEMMISKMGEKLYQLYVEGYTKRQWKRDPSELDASLASRVCVRDDSGGMFDSQLFCWMPVNGFTDMILNMIDHANIRVYLGINLNIDYLIELSSKFDEVLISASPEDILGVKEDLPYIHVEFDFIKTFSGIEGANPYVAVYNYCKDDDNQYSRYTIYNNFVNNLNVDIIEPTIVGTEKPLKERSSSSVKCYPITVHDKEKHQAQHRIYQSIVKDLLHTNTHFIGRLGRYEYLDMDKAIESTMEVVNNIIGDGK